MSDKRKEEASQKVDFREIHTLNEWVCVWLREVLPNVVKESTIRMYTDTMERHILPSLGTLRLEDITEQTVRNWLKKLQSTPVPGTRDGCMTEGTVRNTLSVLSGCMRDLQKYGLIDQNPCMESGWTLKYRKVDGNQDWLNEDQLRQLEPLLAAYRDRNGYPLGIGFQLLLYTGITLSEAAALRWEDVDFEEEKISLRYFVSMKWVEDHGKKSKRQELETLSGRKRREVLVPGSLIQKLKQVKMAYRAGPQDFVLSRPGEEPVGMDQMRAALLRKGSSCGLGRVTPRMLRDTYAMRAVHAGASSDTIAEIMGFSSSRQVIRRYMSRTVTDKRELLKKMFGE